MIASSAHAVEHHLRLLFYELGAAAAIMTFHRVRHTSRATGMTAVPRPHSHPSGLIGNSCFASSAFFVMKGRISGIILRRGRLTNCIIGILRSVRGGNRRGRGWRGCALGKSCLTLTTTHVCVFFFHVVILGSSGLTPCHVDIFGVPLNESVLRASATAILGGCRHDLPLVVFLCVEELYRTGKSANYIRRTFYNRCSRIGIYKSGLFRDLPNRQRHHELSTLFDTPPAFGEGMSLRAESTADICALLLTYLKELPEPVLTPYLFNAFWNWSVRPSVKREDERMRKEQDEEEDLRTRFFQTGQRPPRPSRRVLYEKARLRAAQDETAEAGQVTIARDLLRLLPTHSFSLIVYLCAFFTQVPLCPENGITFEDIGRIFGPPVFGGPVPAARRMMVWFLKRWNRVSDGLLDADSNSDDSQDADGSSPPLLLRRDMRNLELKLLAPEEQEEDELVDFRASLTDSADPEDQEYSYQATIRRDRGNAGVMTPPSSQNQDTLATQEMAWVSRRKGSTGPDDPTVMQVPARDCGHSSTSESYCVFQ